MMFRNRNASGGMYVPRGDTHRSRHLETNYGITVEQRNQMARQQNYSCAICGLIEDCTGTLHVDHDHTTNKVRGLLCSNCNHALGMFRDSVGVLKAAVVYLEKHK